MLEISFWNKSDFHFKYSEIESAFGPIFGKNMVW